MSNTDPQTNTTNQRRLQSVPAGPAFAEAHDRKVAAAQRREDRNFKMRVGAAAVSTVAAVSGLVGVGSHALSERQAPPETPAVAPPATGDVTPNPAEITSVPLEAGSAVWTYAANRTPKGGDTAPMEATITEQLDDDGVPGAQAYNPADGTGDVLELGPTLPVNADANPHNDTPQG